MQAFSSGAQMLLFAKAPRWNRWEEEMSPSHLPLGLLILLSPIFHCHKIKDGGYNSTNTNKVSPTQNTPALQAMKKSKVTGKNQDLCLWSWCPYHRSKTPLNSTELSISTTLKNKWTQYAIWHSERARASAPQAYQCKITQSTGMATQMQLKVLFGTNSHGRPDF